MHDPSPQASLTRNRQQWTKLGAEDPYWAILSEGEPGTGSWDPEAFFKTGRDQRHDILCQIRHVRPDFQMGSALDFGCGVGRMTQAFATDAISIVGVDVSAPMIERANAFNQHPEKCRYLVNERGDLSIFSDASFDFVYSHIVLQHIPSVLSRSFIAEFTRILKPGGLCFFQIPQLAEPRLCKENEMWGFDMYGIDQSEVLEMLYQADCRILEVIDDHWCGPGILSYRYIFEKFILPPA